MTVRYVVDLVHEDRALLGQFVHNIAVVDDFAANINRRAEGLQCDLHNVDGAHYARTKTTGFQKEHSLLTRGSPGGKPVGGGFKGSRSHFSIITIGLFPGRREWTAGTGRLTAAEFRTNLDVAKRIGGTKAFLLLEGGAFRCDFVYSDCLDVWACRCKLL